MQVHRHDDARAEAQSGRQQRVAQLRELLRQRVLVIDGAMGTEIQRRRLTAADFGGASYEGCNEYLAITRPDVITDIHTSYLEAGADIIETDTFGSTSVVLAEYGLADRAYEITLAAAQLARQAADEFTKRTGQPRFVAGSMGPTTKAISVVGGITFSQLVQAFHDQAQALVAGGVDYLLLETAQDTRNIKAGLIGIEQLFSELGVRVPVAVSATIERSGTMLAGQKVEALITSLEHANLLYLGLNCATGPEEMADHVRALASLSPFPVAVVPNAGLPDENGCYLETPAAMRQVLGRFIQQRWVNLIGGCCGTTPEHIQALVRLVRETAHGGSAATGEREGRGNVSAGTGAVPVPVHQPLDPAERGTCVSGIENLEIDETTRPVIVGERTNVIGSRLFKKLIAAGNFDEASEIARRQVRDGAQIIDICLADPDRNEKADMESFMASVIGKVKVPLMIDSTDPDVIEAALTYCQGKSIINSINLEDGEGRFQKVVPLVRRYGAALVVGTIDEQGMAVSHQRKLAIARRAYDLLVNRYGVPARDIIFDPLTFPCASGDEQYKGSALETITAIRSIKQELPQCKTILGISNVSFGLPPAGREVVNAVFLHHCVEAGLDLAIVNTERLRRYATLSEQERRLAEDVLLHPDNATITAFASYFRPQAAEQGGAARAVRPQRPTPRSSEERLAALIVEGSKDGLVEALEEELQKGKTPLAIINGPLMAGMQEVGRLFNRNELIVAEVLRSAEVMKAAVAYLEPLIKGDQQNTGRGTVLLATVKGDVHDIGKNLVEIILANNGYRVINLGIKVPPAEIIGGIRQYRPDIVGLSGLLVKSAQQMVMTAEEMTAAGTCPPLLVGGAALTEKFVRTRIAPAYGGLVVYARDAMQGLDLANRLMTPAGRRQLEEEWGRDRPLGTKDGPGVSNATRSASEPRAVVVPSLVVPDLAPLPPSGVPRLSVGQIPRPPDYERHVLHLQGTQLDEIWAYVNPVMLYNRHLGLKTGVERALADGDPQALRLRQAVAEVQEECRRGRMQVGLVWRFFGAAGTGDCIRLYVRAGAGEVGWQEVAVLPFPRQQGGERLCLADYVHPLGADGQPCDNVCLLAVTAGQGIRLWAEEWRRQGNYLRSHILQALALEAAEAAAEWLHQQIRTWWGFPDPPELTMKERFQARYRGRRYSFGYPACPDLSLQQPLFALLQPEEIGLSLTEGFMMDPEASVSALVIHHPLCKYFEV